jgi:flavin reductase (DIM6/NTAB) family NADH-FMN oxidoreductase RutF
VDVRESFNAIVGNLEYPMFIVTARAGDERLGCLVGFATQASIDPSRFVVGLSRANRTHRRGRDSAALAVHCVPADAPDLAELFGGETGDEVDKFARCAWRDGPEGLPILDRCERWFVGRVVDRLDAGDHELFLLDPVAARPGREDDFTFHRAKRIEPGHPA